jgi:transcription antitermination factor NusG
MAPAIKFAHGGVRPGAGRKPAPVITAQPITDVPRWYCVRTGHGAELTADIEIRLAGFTLFAPSLWKPATPARRDAKGAMHAAKPARIVPLFPRYLFVQFVRAADAWQQIRRLPGVDGFIGASDENPSTVPEQAIALLRRMCQPNECVYPPKTNLQDLHAPVPLDVGSSARLLSGPMAELVGIVAMSDGRRVRLLLEIMGSLVPADVEQAAVEPV